MRFCVCALIFIENKELGFVLRPLIKIAAICAIIYCFGTLFWMLQVAKTPLSMTHFLLLLGGIFATFVALMAKEPWDLGSSSSKRPDEPEKPRIEMTVDEMLSGVDSQEIGAVMEELEGHATRPAEIPGWAIRLVSPYADTPPPNSWFGGRPALPADFEWPRNTAGQAMNFVAQIDLGEIPPEPETTQRIPGLPEAGTMVVFANFRGDLGHLITIFPEHSQLRERSEPDDLEATFHYRRKAVFPKWHFELIPYLDSAEATPPGILGEEEPHEWITNWGLALAELDAASYSIRSHRGDRNRHLSDLRRMKRSEWPGARGNPEILERTRFYRQVSNLLPPLHKEIAAFRKLAENHDPSDAVDQEALQRLMSARMDLVANLPANAKYGIASLNCDHQSNILHSLLLERDVTLEEKLSDLPECFHDFVSKHISAWRGHRLFGQKLPKTTSILDFRSVQCVLDIKADYYLGTESEHQDGFSIWTPIEALTAGDWSKTKMYHHTNV
nr:DUF1963 domain-containing protein [Roseibium sp. RKSG952]